MPQHHTRPNNWSQQLQLLHLAQLRGLLLSGRASLYLHTMRLRFHVPSGRSGVTGMFPSVIGGERCANHRGVANGLPGRGFLGRPLCRFHSMVESHTVRRTDCSACKVSLMSYSVRHQVFVSSTFTDLKEERSEVIQAIWELDCIPTGMEAFVASNESQWSVISRVIDECDYYVLIIGGRYGSVTNEGLSYTEKEYRYAKSVGIPVIAFVHGDPQQIPVGKSESEAGQKAKLEAFRAGVMAEHPIRTWSTASELGGLVSRSLVREIKTTPRPGWIRNDGSSPIALLEQVNKLTQENAALREVAATELEPDADLASGKDPITLSGTWNVYISGQGFVDEIWSLVTNYDDIFRDLGPALINEATERRCHEIIEDFKSLAKGKSGKNGSSPVMYKEDINEVMIQFRALGLIQPGVKKRGVNDRGSYWAITPRGDAHLVKLLAKKKPIA